MVGQSAHETNFWASNLAVNHNNLFGMRPSHQRTKFYQGISENNNGQFASYSSPENSVRDYLDLLRVRGVDTNQEVNSFLDEVTEFYQGWNASPSLKAQYSQRVFNIMNGVIIQGGSRISIDPERIQAAAKAFEDVTFAPSKKTSPKDQNTAKYSAKKYLSRQRWKTALRWAGAVGSLIFTLKIIKR